MSTAEITPTRSELIALKKKIKIADRGHQILEMKRDGLIHEFFELLHHAKNLRSEVTDSYRIAKKSLLIAKTVEGTRTLDATALVRTDEPSIHLATRSVMGVMLPKITPKMDIRRNVATRGYGIIGVPATVDETVGAYEDVLEKVILAAEVETSLKKLIEEIESTKRRVNALQYKVIPSLKFAAKYIGMKLQEQERENIFRLKRIKE